MGKRLLPIFLCLILLIACLYERENSKLKSDDHSIITNKLSENNGWFQGIIGDSIFNTIGNATKETISSEVNNGWEFVGWYSPVNFLELKSYLPNNLTVFKRPLMKFFYKSNPWQNKMKIPWLPDLDYAIKNDDKIQLTTSLGHNCPSIIRKCVCSCKNDVFHLKYNDKVILGQCIQCEKVVTIWNNEIFELNYYSDNLFKIKDAAVTILYSIEYPVDSESGDDFSWILIYVQYQGQNTFNIADGEI